MKIKITKLKCMRIINAHRYGTGLFLRKCLKHKTFSNEIALKFPDLQ